MDERVKGTGGSCINILNFHMHVINVRIKSNSVSGLIGYPVRQISISGIRLDLRPDIWYPRSYTATKAGYLGYFISSLFLILIDFYE